MSQAQHTELLGLSLQQLTGVVEDFGQAPYRARQLLDGLYRQMWSGLDSFATLPLTLRQQLTDSGYVVGLPKVEKKFVSLDGTIRYLLAFADGQSVETVWMPEGDGGEAGDGSEMGDAELRGLNTKLCHPERSESAVADERSRRTPLTERSLSAHSHPRDRWQRATICVRGVLRLRSSATADS